MTDDNVYVVGRLVRRRDGGLLVKLTCPYCSQTHTHGWVSNFDDISHRLSHCIGLRAGGYHIRLDPGLEAEHARMIREARGQAPALPAPRPAPRALPAPMRPAGKAKLIGKATANGKAKANGKAGHSGKVKRTRKVRPDPISEDEASVLRQCLKPATLAIYSRITAILSRPARQPAGSPGRRAGKDRRRTPGRAQRGSQSEIDP